MTIDWASFALGALACFAVLMALAQVFDWIRKNIGVRRG